VKAAPLHRRPVTPMMLNVFRYRTEHRSPGVIGVVAAGHHESLTP
jgi:hypothetical protein